METTKAIVSQAFAGSYLPDEQIEGAIVTAAKLVNFDTPNFSFSVNLTELTVDPSPDDDVNSLVLVSLKAIQLLEQYYTRKALRVVGRVNLGPAVIANDGKHAYLLNECATDYNAALAAYRAGQPLTSVIAITTPLA